MSNFRFDVDIKELTKGFEDLKKKVTQDLKNGVENLASMTHAKLREIATDELGGGLNKIYQENIEFTNPEENLWVVTLKEKAVWIDEGRKSGFMEELLRGKSSNTNKKGEKYAVIPFEHSKKPSEQSTKAKELSEQLKSEFKKRKIPWKKIEVDKDGNPRIGLVHRFDVASEKPSARAKHEALQGVAVYQTKTEGGKVRRDVMTFRVISEKHREEGLWMHPGMEGKHLMEKAFEWAQKEWKDTILPSIMSQYK